MAQIELLMEAQKRGLPIPEDKAALLNEAIKRGLIEDVVQNAPPTEEMLLQAEGIGGQIAEKQQLQASIPPQADNVKVIQSQIDELNKQQQAIESGVDIGTGLPDQERFKIGFAANESIAADFIQDELSKKYNQPIPVRKGPITGQLEFFNPEQGRFTTFQDSGLSFGDVAEVMGPALTMGGDIAGSILGFIGGSAVSPGPGSVAGETVGAGIGAGLGEEARLRLGRMLGVNKALTDEQINRMALSTGSEAGLFSLIARGVTTAGGRLINGPRAFTPEAAQAIEEAASSSKPIVDEINSRIDGEFNPSLASRSGLPTVIREEATLRSGAENVEIDRAFTNAEQQNKLALEEFYDKALGGGAERSATGQAVQDALSKQTDPRLDKARGVVEDTTSTAEKAVNTLPSLNEPLAGQELRQALDAARNEAAEAENKAWDEVRELAGFNKETASSNIRIPRDENINASVSALSAESKKALISGEATSKDRLINRLVKKEGDDFSILGADGKPLLKVDQDFSVNEFDLVQLNSAISHLRRQIRVSSKGLTADDPTTGDAKRLLTSLTQARNSYLRENNPELLKKISDAELLSSERARTFDRSLAGTFLKESDGAFVIRDADVFNNVFKANNGEAAREIAGIISSDPRAMQAVRNHVFSLYKNTVARDGLPDAKLHKRFMEEFGDVIKPFFREDDFAKLNTFGEFGETIAKQSEQLARIEKNFERSFRGKIRDLNPESIVKAFFGTGRTKSGKTSFNESDARKLKNFLGVNQIYDQTRDAITDEIKRRVMPGGVFDFNKLDALLKEHGNKIASFAGAQYRRDLEVLARGVEISSRAGKPFAKEGQPGPIKLFRALLGPLSKRQRLITAGRQVKASSRDAAMARALLDPDMLHALTYNRNANLNNRNVISILSSLGAIELEQEVPE